MINRFKYPIIFIIGIWLITLFIIFNAWNYYEARRYFKCGDDLWRGDECNTALLGTQPIFKCADVISTIMLCEDTFINPCNTKAYNICDTILVSYKP